MSITNGTKITAPVSVAEVAAVLGENSLDVGTLCLSLKINPWSKVKPQWLPDTYETPAEIDMATRKIAVDAKWGLRYPIRKSQTELQNTLRTSAGGRWLYAQPNWYRLTDFDGYDHKAGCFLPFLPDEQTVGVPPTPATQPVAIETRIDVLSQDSIAPEDFTFSDGSTMTLAQGYLGIALRIPQTTGTWYFGTNSTAGLRVPLKPTFPGMTKDTLLGGVGNTSVVADAWLFVANYNMGLSTNTPANPRFIPLNQGLPKKITFTTYGNNVGYSLTIRADWDKTNQRVTAYLYGHNYENGSAKFNGSNNSLVDTNIRVFLSESSTNPANNSNYKDVAPFTVQSKSSGFSNAIVFQYTGTTTPWIIVPDCYVGSTHLSAQAMCLTEAPTEPPSVVDPSAPGGWNDLNP